MRHIYRLTIVILFFASTFIVPAAAQNQQLPQFEPVEECFVTLPGGFTLGEKAECGYVTVPENRDNPENNRTIRLAVVVIHPLMQEPLPDPVMYLDGGPGFSMMRLLTQGGYQSHVHPILETGRSVIFFAQRGVIPSEPAIEGISQCDPIYAAQRDALNGVTDVALSAYRAAWADCFEHLSAIVDLTAYHATASAADANAIRQALGYEQVNLWGISYGTRIGLTILRDYPDGVRAAIFDSVLPLDTNYYGALFTNAVANAERLFDACASDVRCSEIVADLRATFFKTAAVLDSEPIVVTRRDTASGETIKYILTGQVLLPVASSVDTYSLPYVPKIILEAREGRLVEAMQGIRPGWPEPYTVHLMLSMIAQCNELLPFYALEEIRAAATTDYGSLFPIEVFTVDICGQGEFRTPPPFENQPVFSDVPTLLLAGEYDSATPPYFAERAAATLENSYVYTVPFTSHATISAGECIYDVMKDFLNDPASVPNTSCFALLEDRFQWAAVLPSRR